MFVIQLQWYVNVYKRLIVAYIYELCEILNKKMLRTLQLKDIFVGKTDAKNEFIENSTSEISKFIDSYLIPENITIEDFEKGSKYYITGLKGTGKTALLRYLEVSFNK